MPRTLNPPPRDSLLAAALVELERCDQDEPSVQWTMALITAANPALPPAVRDVYQQCAELLAARHPDGLTFDPEGVMASRPDDPLALRFLPAEVDAITARAREAGLPPVEWARRQLLGDTPPEEVR